MPPKYTSADFSSRAGLLEAPGQARRTEGALRLVPPGRPVADGDPSLLVGWAGWDHREQVQALATVYLDRKSNAAWPAQRLLPLLAGIAELEPWLHQWYAEHRPGFPGSPAEFFSGLIDTELSILGADRATLRTLRGVEELP